MFCSLAKLRIRGMSCSGRFRDDHFLSLGRVGDDLDEKRGMGGDAASGHESVGLDAISFFDIVLYNTVIIPLLLYQYSISERPSAAAITSQYMRPKTPLYHAPPLPPPRRSAGQAAEHQEKVVHAICNIFPHAMPSPKLASSFA